MDDGGVQDVMETDVDAWEPKHGVDAMSAALGPWFVQVRCQTRRPGSEREGHLTLPPEKTVGFAESGGVCTTGACVCLTQHPPHSSDPLGCNEAWPRSRPPQSTASPTDPSRLVLSAADVWHRVRRRAAATVSCVCVCS